jgi:hypothetical protein
MSLKGCRLRTCYEKVPKYLYVVHSKFVAAYAIPSNFCYIHQSDVWALLMEMTIVPLIIEMSISCASSSSSVLIPSHYLCPICEKKHHGGAGSPYRRRLDPSARASWRRPPHGQA